MNVLDFLPLPSGGDFITRQAGHLAAVIDGFLHETASGRGPGIVASTPPFRFFLPEFCHEALPPRKRQRAARAPLDLGAVVRQEAGRRVPYKDILHELQAEKVASISSPPSP